MPQLVPFFFLNQLFYGYLILFAILVLSSYVILPYILKLRIARIIIAKF
ncbi:ATP synthase F0 subunit 8 (mitochondrion) [Ogataea philodendri]|uniref:ATP synthase protein 8 n=1 Tax=Ogataea philodendri TaxID=1378263 RepID=S5U5M1_9ASCO|nr:ATP synthase F0 subunit 8 [Ogataea philodendri]AGS44406.1 ATP synthase F0 subunit 8 [Ogataea philodendri]